MKVFLDMDGVLVDFRRGICEAFDRDDPSTSWEFWENWKGVTTKDVSNVCNIDFWVNLNWTSDGMCIYQTIRRKFLVKDIYLLTTPMPNFNSYTGKVLWVSQHMPVFNKQLIITPAPKSLLAGSDTLLIDDKDENIEEFVAAGGQGILVPAPYNELHGWLDKTLQVVKNSLEAF